MSNSKDNKNNNSNITETTKKTSLPLIVGTGAMLLASVMTLDHSISLEATKLDNLNSACYVQNDDDETENPLDENSKDDKNTLPNDDNENSLNNNDDEFQSYLRNSSGELFYDSSAEDDKAYYGNWDRLDDSDNDDEFILW